MNSLGTELDSSYTLQVCYSARLANRLVSCQQYKEGTHDIAPCFLRFDCVYFFDGWILLGLSIQYIQQESQ